MPFVSEANTGLMADQHQHPTVIQKVAGQLHLSSSAQACYGAYQNPALSQRRFSYGNYSCAALQYPTAQTCRATHDLSFVAANASHVFVMLPQRKGLQASPLIFLWVEFPLPCLKLLLLLLFFPPFFHDLIMRNYIWSQSGTCIFRVLLTCIAFSLRNSSGEDPIAKVCVLCARITSVYAFIAEYLFELNSLSLAKNVSWLLVWCAAVHRTVLTVFSCLCELNLQSHQ